jgi:hypothetical protein
LELGKAGSDAKLADASADPADTGTLIRVVAIGERQDQAVEFKVMPAT